MKHYEIIVWINALKMMLRFRRVLFMKREDAYTRMDALQCKVFLGFYLVLTVAFSWGKNLGEKLVVLTQTVVLSQNIWRLLSQTVVFWFGFFFLFFFFEIMWQLLADFSSMNLIAF